MVVGPKATLWAQLVVVDVATGVTPYGTSTVEEVFQTQASEEQELGLAVTKSSTSRIVRTCFIRSYQTHRGLTIRCASGGRIIVVVVHRRHRNISRNKNVDDGYIGVAVGSIDLCLHGHWHEAGASGLHRVLVGISAGVCSVSTLVSLGFETLHIVCNARQYRLSCLPSALLTTGGKPCLSTACKEQA